MSNRPSQPSTSTWRAAAGWALPLLPLPLLLAVPPSSPSAAVLPPLLPTVPRGPPEKALALLLALVLLAGAEATPAPAPAAAGRVMVMASGSLVSPSSVAPAGRLGTRRAVCQKSARAASASCCFQAPHSGRSCFALRNTCHTLLAITHASTHRPGPSHVSPRARLRDSVLVPLWAHRRCGCPSCVCTTRPRPLAAIRACSSGLQEKGKHEGGWSGWQSVGGVLSSSGRM